MSVSATAPLRTAQRPSQSPGTGTPSKWRWIRAILSGIPNLLVFGLLAAVFCLGHHSGWKIPKFSELMGNVPAKASDWCAEHLVPESECVECVPDLMPKGKEFGFCRQHGVAECVLDHPELAQVIGRPQLPEYDTLHPLALVARPENNSRNTLHKARIQFASAESAIKAGVDVGVVQERPMQDFISANGELTFDPTRVAHLSAKVPGTVAVVFKTVGDKVQAGEALALVDAAHVGQLKSQVLQAMVQIQLRKRTAERQRSLVTIGGVAVKTAVEAEAALQEAEISFVTARQALANLGFELPDQIETQDAKQVAEDLRYLGIPPAVVSSLPVGNKTSNLIPVRAPYEGVLVESTVVAGEVVDTTNILFTVADPRQMRLLLSIRQEDSRYLKLGLPVQFDTDNADEKIAGTISWISPAVDQHSRTLPVRVKLANQQGRLRDKTFGTGRIILREEPKAVVVPREAVQSTSDAHFIFVRDKNYLKAGSPKVFHVRQVRTGARDDKHVELLAGVLPGEVIATKGSPVLLAQLLRGSLGAGCGCHDH